ncbi:MAG: aldehyde dehydrogenase family protein [Oligoflexia bacterium]|nr:aldehyde dehydrogenase family protein [Oligoflexia bacterium]
MANDEILANLPEIFARARAAQQQWSVVPLQKRARMLKLVRENLLDAARTIEGLIVSETGKPANEALLNEILPAAELLTFLSRSAGSVLKTQPIRLHLFKHYRSQIEYAPIGPVAVLSPWNYPLLLSLSTIASAVVAGNAVIFKPSEYASGVGLAIQSLFDNSALPANLVQTVLGGAAAGSAIIEHRPGKVFFTGGTENGRKVALLAAQHLIPAQMELGGKNPMIVLADANLDYATSAALWGGFSNSGQMCASTDRILVHESIKARFVELLVQKIETLKQHPGKNFGHIVTEKQKASYRVQLEDASKLGIFAVTGGTFSEDGTRLAPTVLEGANIEKSLAYRDETFGPIVTVTTFRSTAEAVEKANDSTYGLSASIITRNISLGARLASQLQVGTVTLNETAYTAGLAEAPWGGIKNSGWGISRSERGLLEFVYTRHVHRPRFRWLTFKSPWWFPYTPFQHETAACGLELYRRHWSDKLRVFPHFVWNLVQFLKSERRL